jgi:hypothetical protein
MVKHGDGSWLGHFDHQSPHVDCAELARLAVEEKGGGTLKYVDPKCTNYADIAKLAVRNDGLALNYVANVLEYPELYDQVAWLAVVENGEAFQYVDKERVSSPSRYDEIQKLAWKSRRLLHRV